MEKFESDFIPYTFQVPIAVYGAKVEVTLTADSLWGACGTSLSPTACSSTSRA